MIEKTDSPKHAEEIEQHLFKVVVKCYFLVDAKKVPVNDLLLADKPLREALSLFNKCYEHIKFTRTPHPELVKEKLKVKKKKIRISFSSSLFKSAYMHTHKKKKGYSKIID